MSWGSVIAADVIRGRLCSAYPACAAEVKLAGGQYADIAVTEAITDGHFVTAPALLHILHGFLSLSKYLELKLRCRTAMSII